MINGLRVCLNLLDAGDDRFIESEPADLRHTGGGEGGPVSAQERLEILRHAEPNSWIAFSSDESKVVARATSYSEAVAFAERSGEDDPVLVKIPEEWLPLAL
jgi:hypothetical protein